MEIRALRYFVAVAESEHFGEAATRLHISQSAVSAQVMKLESELGAPLFERLPRGVRLSDDGRVFLPEAQHILALVKQGTGRALRAAHGHLERRLYGNGRLAGRGAEFITQIPPAVPRRRPRV